MARPCNSAASAHLNPVFVARVRTGTSLLLVRRCVYPEQLVREMGMSVLNLGNGDVLRLHVPLKKGRL